MVIKDKVTGVSGIAKGFAYDLYGCVQVLLNIPESGKNRWFDVNRFDNLKVEVPPQEVLNFLGYKAKLKDFKGIKGIITSIWVWNGYYEAALATASGDTTSYIPLSDLHIKLNKNPVMSNPFSEAHKTRAINIDKGPEDKPVNQW